MEAFTPSVVSLTSGLAKARLCGELAGRPPSVCDSAGPLGVRSLPLWWREGRICSLGDADATGNWACGGVHTQDSSDSVRHSPTIYGAK